MYAFNAPLYITDHIRIDKQQNSKNTYTDALPTKGQTKKMHDRQNVVIVLFQLSVNVKNPFENFSLHNPVRGAIESSIPF